MHAPGIWGIIIVAVVVILLFGRGKISGMMGEMASGIKAFQKGMKDEDKPRSSTPQLRSRAARPKRKTPEARRPRSPAAGQLPGPRGAILRTSLCSALAGRRCW